MNVAPEQISQLVSSLDRRKRERLERIFSGCRTPLDEVWIAPHKFADKLDPWQEEVLAELVTRSRDVAMCCSRQVGKTEVVSLAAYLTAAQGSFVLVITPSDDQSLEFMVRVYSHERRLRLAKYAADPTKHELLLEGGGRILALPNNERTVRVYSSVDLLIIDEAARVPDALFGAVSPMLAVSGGKTALLSTPYGQRGFFYKEWIGKGSDKWRRYRCPWHACPRLTEEFIASERRSHGDAWCDQEYCHLPTNKVMGISGPIQVSSLKVGDKIRHRGGECNVIGVWKSATQPTVKVRTECGTLFEASVEHPIRDAGQRVKLVDADAVVYHQKRFIKTDKESCLARLVAWNTGDGTITLGTPRRPRAQGCEWYSKYDFDLYQLAQDVEVVTGYKPKVKPMKGKYGGHKVSVYGDRLITILSAGAPSGKKKYKRFVVPDWVLASPELGREYVAALFGAEGVSPTLHRENKIPQLTLSMYKDKEEDGVDFFQGLVDILTSLGIPSNYRRRFREDEWCFTLEIRGGAVGKRKFLDEVGYRYCFLKEYLAFQWSMYLGAYLEETVSRCEEVRAMRSAGMSFTRINKELGISNALTTHEGTKRTSWKFPLAEEWVSNRTVEDGGIRVAVTKKEVRNPTPTMNIEVDSPDHSYLMADGLENYNCLNFQSTTAGLFDMQALENCVIPEFEYQQLEW
jgi:hypothetical protein